MEAPPHGEGWPNAHQYAKEGDVCKLKGWNFILFIYLFI